jgi:hypothetical protein
MYLGMDTYFNYYGGLLVGSLPWVLHLHHFSEERNQIAVIKTNIPKKAYI